MSIGRRAHGPGAPMFLVTERTGDVAQNSWLMQEMARVTFLTGFIQGRHVAPSCVSEFFDLERPRRGMKCRGNNPARPGLAGGVAGRAVLIKTVLALRNLFE